MDKKTLIDVVRINCEKIKPNDTNMIDNYKFLIRKVNDAITLDFECELSPVNTTVVTLKKGQLKAKFWAIYGDTFCLEPDGEAKLIANSTDWVLNRIERYFEV